MISSRPYMGAGFLFARTGGAPKALLGREDSRLTCEMGKMETEVESPLRLYSLIDLGLGHEFGTRICAIGETSLALPGGRCE